MLPKNQRIPRELFGNLKKANILSSNDLLLIRGVSQPSGPSRFCVSVSKKVAKKAVLRNKLRRKGYKSIKSLYLSIQKPVLAQISFKKAELNDKVINESIKSLFQKTKII